MSQHASHAASGLDPTTVKAAVYCYKLPVGGI